MENLWVSMVSIIIALLASIISFVSFSISKRRQDEIIGQIEMDKQIGKLEQMREFYERQIYQLNNKMVATEERWKDANHLVISPSITSSSKEVTYTDFLKNFGIDKLDLEINKESVFVLMPFIKEMDETYRTISLVCNNVGLNCSRADATFVRGDILPHIIRAIVKSRIIVAILDGRNPNVFYELGIAHALGKTTILLSKSESEAPFNLKSQSIILYKDHDDLSMQLTTGLTKALVKV